MVAAMANGALDGGCVVDPIASQAIREGIAFRAAGDDVMYPNQQLAVILYGASILKQPDLGVHPPR
jgi:NitT/TauT family transport system substrate-binding protein